MPRAQTNALHQQLRADILSLALTPDAPLRLPKLAERYGAGLTPLRECLNRLSGEKLVVTEHNKGFRVAPVSLQDLLDLEHARSAIEGALFADAILHGDDAWEAGVVGQFRNLAKSPFPSVMQSPEELAHWTRRHAAFHDALLAAAPSRWMHQFRGELAAQLLRYQRFIANGLRDLATAEAHKAVSATAALSRAMETAAHIDLRDTALDRDAARAAEVIAEHSNLSIRAFEQLTELLPNPERAVA